MRDGHQPVRHLRHLWLWPTEAEGIDEHEAPREPRMLERNLERDPASQRRADDGRAAQATVVHVALDEAREIADRVADIGFLAMAVTGQVRREHSMPQGRALEVEAPFHVTR